MTRLEIEPRVATKAAVFRGAVASGEAVDVTVRGAAAWTAGALRLRILGELDGEVATLAQFPMPAEDGGQADAWAVDGEDARCLLNLDTVQMERSVPCGAAERRLLVLDDPRGQTLYVKDLLPIAHWPRAKGEDVPVDLGGYRDLIAEVEGALAEEVRRAKAAEMLNAEEAARAKGAADTHAARTDNPHGVTAKQVGALAAVSVPGFGDRKIVSDLTEFSNGIMLTGLGNIQFTGGEYGSIQEMAAAKANKATTLAGYGIIDAAAKSELDTLAAKVDNANAALEEVA